MRPKNNQETLLYLVWQPGETVFHAGLFKSLIRTHGAALPHTGLRLLRPLNFARTPHSLVLTPNPSVAPNVLHGVGIHGH